MSKVWVHAWGCGAERAFKPEYNRFIGSFLFWNKLASWQIESKQHSEPNNQSLVHIPILTSILLQPQLPSELPSAVFLLLLAGACASGNFFPGNHRLFTDCNQNDSALFTQPKVESIAFSTWQPEGTWEQGSWGTTCYFKMVVLTWQVSCTPLGFETQRIECYLARSRVAVSTGFTLVLVVNDGNTAGFRWDRCSALTWLFTSQNPAPEGLLSQAGPTRDGYRAGGSDHLKAVTVEHLFRNKFQWQ